MTDHYAEAEALLEMAEETKSPERARAWLDGAAVHARLAQIDEARRVPETVEVGYVAQHPRWTNVLELARKRSQIIASVRKMVENTADRGIDKHIAQALLAILDGRWPVESDGVVRPAPKSVPRLDETWHGNCESCGETTQRHILGYWGPEMGHEPEYVYQHADTGVWECPKVHTSERMPVPFGQWAPQVGDLVRMKGSSLVEGLYPLVVTHAYRDGEVRVRNVDYPKGKVTGVPVYDIEPNYCVPERNYHSTPHKNCENN